MKTNKNMELRTFEKYIFSKWYFYLIFLLILFSGLDYTWSVIDNDKFIDNLIINLSNIENMNTETTKEIEGYTITIKDEKLEKDIENYTKEIMDFKNDYYSSSISFQERYFICFTLSIVNIPLLFLQPDRIIEHSLEVLLNGDLILNLFKYLPEILGLISSTIIITLLIGFIFWKISNRKNEN